MQRVVWVKQLLIGAMMVFLFAGVGYADWETVGGSLNNDTGNIATSPSIYYDWNVPYVVFIEAGNIYVKRFTNSAWQPLGTNLNISPGQAIFNPRIWGNNGNIWVSWEEMAVSTNVRQLYVKKWDGFVGWNLVGTGSLNNNIANHVTNSYLTWNDYPYVAFQEAGSIVVKHYNGNSWQQDGGPLPGAEPAISVGLGIYLVSRNNSIYVRKYNGSTWTQMGNSVTASTIATKPNLIYTGTWIVAWQQDDQILARYYDEMETNWIDIGGNQVINSGYYGLNPQLSYDNGALLLAWTEHNAADTLYKIGMKKINEYWTDWEVYGSPIEYSTATYPQAQSLCTGTTSGIVWQEQAGGRFNIFMKAFFTPTATATPTSTCTSTPTATPSVTPAQTGTATITQTATSSPTITPTPTVTQFISATATAPLASNTDFRIYHNQINPNQGEGARIRWSQPQTGTVTIVIYNLLGDKIATLADGQTYTEGNYHEIVWKGYAQDNTPVASGIYIVQFKTQGHEAQGKIAVVK